MNWKYLEDRTPWGHALLVGGGFAIAEGAKISGMSTMLGGSLSGFRSLPPLAILFCVCLAIQVVTEVTSNVVIANIVLPIVAEMARVVNIHPLYLMLPATISCSMSFHTPVGTPPNALVAGLVNIPTKEMVICFEIQFNSTE